MTGLFAFGVLISLTLLVVGLIKPSIISKIFKKELKRKNILLIFGTTTIICFIVVGATAPKNTTIDTKIESAINKDDKAQAPTQSTQTSNVIQNQPTQTQPAKPVEEITPEAKLENLVKQTVSNNKGRSTDWTYIKTENTNNEITISIQVNSFLAKDYLIKNTGELSSKLYQAIFPTEVATKNITIWYYLEGVDKYGNKNNDIGLSYSISATTFNKINWQNFDQQKFCDFLRSETTDNLENICMIKAYIK